MSVTSQRAILSQGFNHQLSSDDLTLGKVYDLTPTFSGKYEFIDDVGDTRRASRDAFDFIHEPVRKLDAVHHPSHYGGDTTYEAIKVIEAWQLGFNLGNVAKYISRAGKKSANTVEDLKKAAFYLNREIANLEAQ